jgi:hypothetical protein
MQELDMCRPIAKRWMYPMETYIKTLKSYVWNTARSEASMVEGYVKEECIDFIMEYLQRFDAVQRQV